jgi:filamentous hemagglutinin family protein
MRGHLSLAQPSPRLVTWLTSSSLLLVLWLAVSQSQVRTTLSSDGTLGTTVIQRGTVYDIKGGTRPENGPNLFHSFDRFSVGTNDTASFTGPAGIKNILSRVTGGQQSEIDGTLRSTIPGAHLYLLNPSGVVFGPNATLDVQGSFHVSTADYLRLADGARFFARLSEQSTLSVAPPVAFGFLGPTPAPITVNGTGDRSTLHVQPGETFSLVGGTLKVAGSKKETAVSESVTKPTLDAPEGRIHLVSVASAGEVVLQPAGQPQDVEVVAVARLGVLELTRGALVDVSTGGERPAGHVTVVASDVRLANGQIQALTMGRGDGGAITVQADTLTLTQGARISSSTRSEGRGGRVTIAASQVSLDNGRISATAAESGSGTGGEIAVQADTLTLTRGASIDVSTSGAGGGGRITIAASQVFEMVGQQGSKTLRSTLDSSTYGSGDAGYVGVSAPTVRLVDNARITTGSVSTGRGGDIEVRGGTVTLTGGSDISADPTGAGSGGRVTVVATEAIRMMGSTMGSATTRSSSGDGGQVFVAAPLVSLEAGSAIGVSTSGPGQGGAIESQVGTLRLTGGATISSGSFGAGRGGSITVRASEAVQLSGGSALASNAERSGDGGRVFVSAPIIHLENNGSRIEALTIGNGNAGNVDVQGTQVTLIDHAQIVASSGRLTSQGPVFVGEGRAGNVTITAQTLTLMGGAQIRSNTRGTAHGGTVTVTTADTLTIAGRDSGLQTTAISSGIGGDIVVQAQQARLTDGAVISAESSGTGNAGSITITVRDTFLSQHSTVTTSASQAKGGNIRVTAPALVRLQKSQITATVGGGTGDGGNVTIDPDFILLQGSQITANAFAGTGGRISLTASKAFLADPSSVITASSTLGINGQVNIQAPVTNISGAVAPLPQAFAPGTELLQSRCAERLRAGAVSRFVLGGRDGVPLEPGSLLLSPMERVAEEGAVQVEERESPPPVAQPGQTWSAPALTLGELEVACARWMGRPGTPGPPKRAK